jgi:serine/threonine protein kinase
VTPKSDVWAMGVIMFLMGSGQMPFSSGDNRITEVIDNITLSEPNYQWIDSPELRELVKWMLMKNPEDRPNAVDILNHPYLKGDIWDRYQGELYPDERIENFKKPENTFVYFGQGLTL